MSKYGPLETSGDHGAEICKSLDPLYLSGWNSRSLFFSYFFDCSIRKIGAPPKNSVPNPNSFWFGRGVTLGPPADLPPPLGQILGR